MDGRPGTGMRGGPLGPLGGTMGPPGTAMRPPTGLRQPMATGLRMGTAMRPGSRAGLGPLNTNIQVAERPVTQQGMMGMKVQAQGPGRQVMDRSYYLAELRKRCQKLSDEIHKMNTEADRYNKDNEIYAKLEKKSQTLIDEVRKLQGDLADLNLIYDKYRNSTDPKDIEVAYLNLKEVNNHTSHECDQILLDRQQKEREIKELEDKIHKLKAVEEEQLNQLPQERKRLYYELQHEHMQLLGDEDKLRAKYDQLCREVGSYEEKIRGDHLKQDLIELQDKRLKVKDRVMKLEDELNKPQLSEAQLKEQLMAQVKKDKEDTAWYQQKITEHEQKIKNAMQELEQLEEGGSAQKYEKMQEEEAKKYQKLQDKDKEMTEYLDTFEDTKAMETQNVKDLQHRITQLLEHISKDIGRQAQLPSKAGFQDMQSEVAMKERMLDHSQTTAERLATEEKERKGELEKIKNLDKKIDDELKSLRERRTTMTEELKKFGNIPQLREEAETNKRNMLARKRRLDGSRKSLKQQVQLLSSEYDKQKQALATNESAGALEALEGQLRHHEQNIYHLKDFIDRKEAETDYTGVYQEVSEQVYDINVLLQQLHSAFN